LKSEHSKTSIKYNIIGQFYVNDIIYVDCLFSNIIHQASVSAIYGKFNGVQTDKHLRMRSQCFFQKCLRWFVVSV